MPIGRRSLWLCQCRRANALESVSQVGLELLAVVRAHVNDAARRHAMVCQEAGKRRRARRNGDHVQRRGPGDVRLFGGGHPGSSFSKPPANIDSSIARVVAAGMP
jgi:hypothetical protein